MANSTKHDLKRIPELLAQGWTQKDPTLFLSLFNDTATYTDHGAQITVPREFIGGHHNNWRGAHEPFEMKLDPYYPIYWMDVDEEKGNASCSFRSTNEGVFVNDLPRRKASGKPFNYSAVTDLIIEGGKIAQADEWLRVPFEDSVPKEKYIVIGGANKDEVMRKEYRDSVS